MYRRYNVALVLSAVIAIVISAHNTVPAQISYSNNPPEPRYSITIGGGWGNYDMKRISGSYYSSAQYSWPFDATSYRRISGGPGAFIEGGYRFWRKASVNIGALHLKGANNDIYETQQFLDDYNSREPINHEFRAWLISPYVELKYAYTIKPLDLFAGLGLSYLFAGAMYSHVIDDYPDPPEFLAGERRDFRSRGVGYLLGAGISYKVSRSIYVSSKMGYRLLQTGDLEDKNGRVWKDMNLDFSGTYLMAGVTLRL